MAHECPECYQTCHCHGDIDDIIFDGTEEQSKCDHCPDDEPEDDDDDYRVYEGVYGAENIGENGGLLSEAVNKGILT
jgi:hypothetical protein